MGGQARPASGRVAWASPGGVTLILCLLVGAFAFLSSAAVLLFGPSSAVDWGMFLVTLMVLVPGALLAGRHLARC